LKKLLEAFIKLDTYYTVAKLQEDLKKYEINVKVNLYFSSFDMKNGKKKGDLIRALITNDNFLESRATSKKKKLDTEDFRSNEEPLNVFNGLGILISVHLVVYIGEYEGTKYRFQVQKAFGDGDCGYSALEVKRNEVKKLLKQESMAFLKNLLSPEIANCICDHTVTKWSKESSQIANTILQQESGERRNQFVKEYSEQDGAINDYLGIA
jgi:hypothetical protein